ncbi:hypothetical protein BOTBODRAFT_34614 [Botryobasidium botryosum FD-172 SS1]|uniref:DUF202 domain-containing protein n=1 Tax=Botryobasidium botryosum (strain FD-172 SS1) TaxID=930990 RepID=A0A067MKG5_BOTB1|nr:hypothetical protein BOTBODRAFT_34614 [Botryobasidium botryosum FD-172 SS1]
MSRAVEQLRSTSCERSLERRETRWYLEGTVENKGSTARDYCAIERTLLTYLRLGLLLSLLSSSLLLHARIPNPEGETEVHSDRKLGVPFGSVYFVAAIAALLVGWWKYEDSSRGLREGRGFIEGSQSTIIETVIALIVMLVIGTCFYLLINPSSSL